MSFPSLDNQPVRDCPGVSDGVKQGIIWALVIFLLAFFAIIRCWCKDRQELNERRAEWICQQQARIESIVRARDEQSSYRSPPPPYHTNHQYEMDYIEVRPPQVYDVEVQLPITPERAVLRENRSNP